MMMMMSIMIKLIRLNHGLHHLLTPIFYSSYTSLVMRIYNLDYVHSVQNFRIFLVITFPPFNLIVDNLKWKVDKNRALPRTQSAVKQTELFKTLQTLISQGIVEKSKSPNYSQILMVPKPDVTHTLTLAYSKQENAIVERYNKEINRHLRALTFQNLSSTDYKKSLPFVQKILNSNHSDRLKISASHSVTCSILTKEYSSHSQSVHRLQSRCQDT